MREICPIPLTCEVSSMLQRDFLPVSFDTCSSFINVLLMSPRVLLRLEEMPPRIVVSNRGRLIQLVDVARFF